MRSRRACSVPALIVLLAQCTAPAPAEPRYPWRAECDRDRLQTVAQQLERTNRRDPSTTNLAARTLIDACDIPFLEPAIGTLIEDYPRFDRLTPFPVWSLMRRAVCPDWDATHEKAATLPFAARGPLLWDTCRFARYGFWDEPTFTACEMTPLPFVVFETLVTGGVDEPTARVLSRDLCQRSPVSSP